MIGDDEVTREWYRMDRTDSEPAEGRTWVILAMILALCILTLLFI